jgi:hypothetical protein
VWGRFTVIEQDMRRRLLTGLLLCVASLWSAGWARPAPVTEHSVKAVFLYKFLPFIEWPANAFAHPDSPFVIGVAGARNVAEELAELAEGRLVSGRRVLVRRLEDARAQDDLHLLYLGAGSRAQIAGALAEAKSRRIVTVTDLPDGLALGSVINFLLVEGRVRFEIAIDAAEEVGVKVSARLLGVAYRVLGRKA